MTQEEFDQMADEMVKDVVKNFKVIRLDRDGSAAWIHAEADTGGRYEVFTMMSASQPMSAGVAVIWPWNSSMQIGAYGPLYQSYVHEKLAHGSKSPQDLAAVTICIGKCLNRVVNVRGIEVQP